jgi:hypothetical protein
VKRNSIWGLAFVVVAAISFAAGVEWQRRSDTGQAFDTPYQAVILDNGQTFYGKLEGYGTPFPILREAAYLQTLIDAATQQQKKVLIKRSDELHAPDRMILNARHILMVESVQPESKATDLMLELKQR